MLVPSVSSLINITTPTQKLALTAAVLASTVIHASQVLIISTTAAHVTLDGTTPDATSFYIPANIPMIFPITPGSVVTTLRDASDGSIYITGVN